MTHSERLLVLQANFRHLLALLVAFALLIAVPATASASGLKIGVVDVEFIILKSKKGQNAKKKLKRIFNKKQKELNAAQEKLLSLKKQLENPSGVTTPEKRKKMLIDYQQGVLKLQEDFVKHQKTLAKKEVELMKPLLKKLEAVLTDFAKAGGFDLILTRSQHGVVFAKPTYDITKAILSKMDAG